MIPSKWDQDHPIWSEWSQTVPYVWMNGELVPFLQAQMPVMSAACRAGVNVFEGIRAYWNEAHGKLYVFRTREHYQRLTESMRIMHLPRPEGVAEMEALLLDTLRANRFQTDVHVIHTVYLDAPGMEALGPIGMYIVARPRGRLHPLGPGITCGVSSWQRMPDGATPFRAKSGGNYLNTRLGGVEVRRHGYDAAIFLNTRGKVAEGGGACVFAIKKGVVITPSVTSDILESITRDTLIELLPRELGLAVEQRDVDRTELYVCDEVFFCGSGWEIVPIRAIDGIPVGGGEVGPLVRKIHDLYFDVVRGNRPDYRRWLTEV
jgi:branched-chain amino acid aminotransferase